MEILHLVIFLRSSRAHVQIRPQIRFASVPNNHSFEFRLERDFNQ